MLAEVAGFDGPSSGCGRVSRLAAGSIWSVDTVISMVAARSGPLSEYQYYEFAAVDRPLVARELDALRSLSTRPAGRERG
jgi:hypothetical protein